MKTAFPNSVLVFTPAKIGFAGNSSSWDGQMAEILFYNRALTTNEQASVQRYLNNRYNLW